MDPKKQLEVIVCYWEAERLNFLTCLSLDAKYASMDKLDQYMDAALDLHLVTGCGDLEA